MKAKDIKFFQKATELASKSDMSVKMGCVVTYKGKIISEGYNQKRTHPLQAEYDKERPDVMEGTPNVHSLHAESSALFRIKDEDIRWNKVEIYISRPMTCRPYGLAKPCPSCQKLISDLGIKTIHYTTDDNSFIKEEWE